MELTAKTRVVCKSGGVLGDLDSLLQQGWDFINHGVTGVMPDDAGAPREIVDSIPFGFQWWESDVDFLTGVPRLEDLSSCERR